MNDLGHTYMADMLMWLVKSGLEQMCIKSLTLNASTGAEAEAFPVKPLRPSLLEPDMVEVLSVNGEGKYKLCAITSGLKAYVQLQDTDWEYNSDGEL